MKFFVLQKPTAMKARAATAFLPADGSQTGQAPLCPLCGKYVGMLPLLPPVRVEIETWGTACGDIAFGPSEEMLISDRFWKLYKASGLTGLVAVGPAELATLKPHKKLHGPVPRYYCCRAARSNAAVDEPGSGLEREGAAPCEECRLGGIIKRARRVVLKPTSWSGEDVFVGRGLPGIVLTSEKFERFCHDNGISNCVLVPAEEFAFDHYPWERGNSIPHEQTV